MNRLLLATAYTDDYARAKPYVMSLKQNCNIPFQCLEIPRDMPGYDMMGCIVQAGQFLDHIDPCETVIFTDADLRMHRPLDGDEIKFLKDISHDQIAACYNKHGEEIFAEELGMLYMRPEGPPPGYDDVRVFNTGFVVARVSTYRRLFNKWKELWPEFNPAFQHYAKIQLCMCAAVHRLGLEWVPVPSHLCAHGHMGCPPGVDGNAKPPTFNGRVICFDHRISH
jgi:hypothetical protein